MFKISKRKQNFKEQYFLLKRKCSKDFLLKKQNTLDPYLCFITSIKMLSSAARAPFITCTSKYTQNSYAYLIYISEYIYDCWGLKLPKWEGGESEGNSSRGGKGP